MMENKPHIVVRALGWAILATSLWSWLGFALGWLWSFPIVFLCVFGIVLSAPLETVLSSRERWHWHRAEVARLQREAKPVAQPQTTTGRTVNLREERWREWFIAKLEKAQELGGIHYIGCMEQVIEYPMWRNIWWRVLYNGGVANHITDTGKKERTTLKDGLTPGGVAAVLKARTLTLPYPEDVDPPA